MAFDSYLNGVLGIANWKTVDLLPDYVIVRLLSFDGNMMARIEFVNQLSHLAAAEVGFVCVDFHIKGLLVISVEFQT